MVNPVFYWPKYQKSFEFITILHWSLTLEKLIQASSQGLKIIIMNLLSSISLNALFMTCNYSHLVLHHTGKYFTIMFLFKNWFFACEWIGRISNLLQMFLPSLCKIMPPPASLSQLIAIKTTTGIWNIENLFSFRIAAKNCTILY